MIDVSILIGSFIMSSLFGFFGSKNSWAQLTKKILNHTTSVLILIADKTSYPIITIPVIYKSYSSIIPYAIGYYMQDVINTIYMGDKLMSAHHIGCIGLIYLSSLNPMRVEIASTILLISMLDDVALLLSKIINKLGYIVISDILFIIATVMWFFHRIISHNITIYYIMTNRDYSDEYNIRNCYDRYGAQHICYESTEMRYIFGGLLMCLSIGNLYWWIKQVNISRAIITKYIRDCDWNYDICDCICNCIIGQYLFRY